MARSRTLFFAAALGLAAAIPGSAILFPANASAVTCYGDYCSGLDPKDSGCAADAYTTVTKETDVGRLDVRWSPTCKTNWARWVEYDRGWQLSMVPLEMRAVQDTGYTQRYSFGVNGGGNDGFSTYYSPMIYSPEHKVKAEMVWQCTGVGDCLISGVEGPLTTAWS